MAMILLYLDTSAEEEPKASTNHGVSVRIRKVVCTRQEIFRQQHTYETYGVRYEQRN